MHHPQQSLVMSKRASIVVICGCVAACAHVETTKTEYEKTAQHSPRQATEVGIVHAEPSESYERLGEIVVKATVNPAPSETRIESELRAAAATMGADAVVVVADRTQQPMPGASQRWWTSSTQTESNREVVGIAIKFR